MSVLVTGHDGYIGTVLVPLFQAAGPRGRRASTASSTAGCALGAEPESPPALEVDIRDVEPAQLRGLRRGRPPGGDLERPARRLPARDDLRRSTTSRRRGSPSGAKEAGVPRFLFSSSCSLYGAAGDALLDETAEFNPVTPYGESKVLRRARPARAGRRQRSARRTCAARRPTASRRGCAATSSSTTSSATRVTTGRGADQERRHAVAAARAHRGHRPRVPRRAGGAARARPRRGVQRRPHRGELPDPRGRRRWSRRSCPDSDVEYAEGGGPDLRCYRVDCDKLAATLPGVPAGVDGARAGSSSSTTRYRGAGLDARRVRRAAASCASSTSRSSQAAGELDDDLRRRPGACRRLTSSAAAPAARRGSRSSCGSATCRCPTGCCARTQLDGPEPRYPLDVAFCADCTLVQILDEVPPAAAVRRQLPLLLVVLGRPPAPLARARARPDRARAGSARTASSSRSRPTTATCCATSSSRASRCSASTRRPTQADAAEAAGVPTLRRVLRHGARRAAARRGPARRRDRRQQRPRAHARPQRPRRRDGRRCSPTTAWSRSRTRTSAT